MPTTKDKSQKILRNVLQTQNRIIDLTLTLPSELIETEWRRNNEEKHMKTKTKFRQEVC